MAKKQSRRSVSMSKSTYERLRAFCEVNEQSMSQFVEERIGDFLGRRGGEGSKSVAAPSPATGESKPAPKKLNGDHIFTF